MKFPSWRSKPDGFVSKRDSVAARNKTKEEEPILARNAEEALITIYIYLYGVYCGDHGFTEEEMQAQLEKINSYDEFVIEMIDLLKKIKENNEI
jgi:hypothetical protein